MAVLGAVGGFRDVRQWYTRIAILERQVCLIENDSGRGPRGTGFLVGPDLLMTAAHVMDRPFTPIVARFDFAVDPDSGEVSDGTAHALADTDAMIGFSPTPELDIALIRLKDQVGNQNRDGDAGPRGWVDLSEVNDEPVAGTAIAIFQHPEGGPLKVAMSTNSVVRFDEEIKRLLYRTDTMPGASGGPCFDIDWRFVAMHTGHAFQLGNLNMGVPISLISGWLRDRGLWSVVSRKPPMRQALAVTMAAAVAEGGTPVHGTFGLDKQLKQLLMSKGESQRLELKERATAQPPEAAKPKKGKKEPKSKISDRLMNSIVAFLNSKEGGSVLIGVSDDRKFVGIEAEYAVVNQQRADWDSYALWLNQTIISNLELRAAFNYFSIARYSEGGKDICAVHVQPSDTPVFLNDVFYVRVNNQNRPLAGHDLLAYVADRWSWLGSRRTPIAANEGQMPGGTE